MLGKLFSTILFVMLAVFAFGQDENEHPLDKKGGFQDIMLYSDIKDYPGLKLKKSIKDEMYPGAELYVNEKGSYTSVGRVKIHLVEVKVYNDSIYEIRIVTEDDPAIYQGIKRNFGEGKYDMRAKAYSWSTNNIVLYYKQGSKNKKELIYHSYIMDRLRREEIRKSYTDVSADF